MQERLLFLTKGNSDLPSAGSGCHSHGPLTPMSSSPQCISSPLLFPPPATPSTLRSTQIFPPFQNWSQINLLKFLKLLMVAKRRELVCLMLLQQASNLQLNCSQLKSEEGGKVRNFKLVNIWNSIMSCSSWSNISWDFILPTLFYVNVVGIFFQSAQHSSKVCYMILLVKQMQKLMLKRFEFIY